MKTNQKTKELVMIALIAALYVVLTITPPLNLISYGGYQFRISEMLVFSAFYNRKAIIGLTIGCMIANFFSFGLIDVFVGGGQTLIFVSLGVLLFARYKDVKLFNGKFNLAYLLFALWFSFSMFVIAAELTWVAQAPFFFTWFTSAVGEFASLMIGGFLFEYLATRFDFSALLN